jgi:hypothetical protein
MGGKQSANIVYVKVVGDAFALFTGRIGGHSVDPAGPHVGDTIEPTIEGAKKPLTLTRVPSAPMDADLSTAHEPPAV